MIMKISRAFAVVAFYVGTVVSSPLVAEVRVPAELVVLNGQYEDSLRKAKAPILDRYLATLNGMLEVFTKAGNLEASLAVNEELKSLKESGKTTSSGENLPELKTARDRYQKESVNVTQVLRARYIAAMEVMVTGYTKRGLLDEALAVKSEVERSKAQAASLGPAPAPSASRRPSDAVFFQGKYYKTFDSVVSWSAAQEKCLEMGGQLATVTRAEENTMIIQMAKMGKRDAYWLGATDKVKEGVWVWVDGRPMTYTNWGPYQPNNKQLAEHYLLVVVRSGNARLNNKWSDQAKTADGHRPGFICEWK